MDRSAWIIVVAGLALWTLARVGDLTHSALDAFGWFFLSVVLVFTVLRRRGRHR